MCLESDVERETPLCKVSRMSTESKMPVEVSEGEKHDLLLFAELKPRLSVVHTVLHIPEHR